MTKQFRDSLFIAFIVLFIIGTTLISIYASGYKFNLKFPPDFNRLLVKTGMLNLDSNPKGAKIFINDKALPSGDWRPWRKNYKVTPNKLRNVIPGEYEVTVEKEGYWPFKALVTVNSGLTTFYEDINLFKSDNPTLKSITDESVNQEHIFLSPNGRYLFLKNSNLLINLDTDKETKLEERENNEKDGLSENKDNFWLRGGNLLTNGQLIDPKNENKNKDFKSLLGKDIYNLKFIETEGVLYYQNENSLSLINLKQNKSELIISNADIIDYLPEDNNLFLLIKEGDKLSVKNYSSTNSLYTQETLLPKGSNYKFYDSYRGNLVIYDEENKVLYLLNKDNIAKGFMKIDEVKDWAQASHGIFFITDWELKYFDIQQGRSHLLARFSINLENIKVNENKNYLVVSADKEIIVYDLKNGFTTNILKAEEISSPALDKNNNFLYFWGRIENQQGVYRISIK